MPDDFERLCSVLDDVYLDQRLTELDQSLLGAVDDLSHGPKPIDQLEVDRNLRGRLVAVGDAAEAIKVVSVGSVDIAYSP